MRLAAIDVGTNTVLLLVAETTGKTPRLRAVFEYLEMPRLGQDLDRNKSLHADAMQRTLAALKRQKERARDHGAERLIVVGTESLRAAKNGDEFLAQTEAVLGDVKLRVISGDEEARLSFRSAAGSLAGGENEAHSVLDIGGGSTELVTGTGNTPTEWASVPIGSVRLTERIVKSDPPTDAEKQELVATIDKALRGLPAVRGELVALAGTATTVAALHLGLFAHDSAKIDGLRMKTADIFALTEKLGGLRVAERQALPGLDARRADVIYAGAMILLRVAERAGLNEVVISDRGVRWGALEELLDAGAAIC